MLARAVGFEPTKTWIQSPVYFPSYVTPIDSFKELVLFRTYASILASPDNLGNNFLNTTKKNPPNFLGFGGFFFVSERTLT